MIDEHKCIPLEPFCVCYSAGIEPGDDCPIHGFSVIQKRCKICGRFIPKKEAA